MHSKLIGQDYLSVQLIEGSSQSPSFPEREYDEKFHILQAPTLFLRDLSYFRAKCEDRELPVAIAFIDIDNFKRFNTDYTEPVVDLNLLPRFMQTLEAHVYHHGYAYRQGGDEYLILLPNMSESWAIALNRSTWIVPTMSIAAALRPEIFRQGSTPAIHSYERHLGVRAMTSVGRRGRVAITHQRIRRHGQQVALVASLQIPAKTRRAAHFVVARHFFGSSVGDK